MISFNDLPYSSQLIDKCKLRSTNLFINLVIFFSHSISIFLCTLYIPFLNVLCERFLNFKYELKYPFWQRFLDPVTAVKYFLSLFIYEEFTAMPNSRKPNFFFLSNFETCISIVFLVLRYSANLENISAYTCLSPEMEQFKTNFFFFLCSISR